MTIKEKLHARWAKEGKEKDGNRCVLCGSTRALNSHHIFAKKSMALRFDPLNHATLCTACHIYGIHHPDMSISLPKQIALKKWLGPEKYAYLEKLKADGTIVTIAQVRARYGV